MRFFTIPVLLAGLASAVPALAQPVPYGYAPRPARGVGYNCEAIQPGFTGPAPFSCPLPGPRRLGARCFCDQPVAPFSGYGGALAGEVVP